MKYILLGWLCGEPYHAVFDSVDAALREVIECGEDMSEYRIYEARLVVGEGADALRHRICHSFQ